MQWTDTILFVMMGILQPFSKKSRNIAETRPLKSSVLCIFEPYKNKSCLIYRSGSSLR